MTSLNSALKSIDTTFLTKICIVKAMVFSVVRYGWESWIIKKTEKWRIDAFELWCWGKLLRTAGSSNQSILKEINPEYSLEGLLLKLNLQYFGDLVWRANSLEKTLMLRKIKGKRKTGRQRMRQLDSITDAMDINLSKLQETVKDREASSAAVHMAAKSVTNFQLNNNNLYSSPTWNSVDINNL